MKDRIKTTKLSTAPVPLRIKEGRVQIILEDKAGNKEVIADHNMQTDAIEAYLANCGWLNSDNLDKTNLVPDLFGGIMLFDGEIDEERLTLSEGLYMIANGGLNITNAGTPYELGSCSEIETETGWQADGSYLQTYRWDESHGNCPQGKSIQSVCLVPKWYGICGEGNGSGEVSSSRGTPRSWAGSATTYSVLGHVVKVSILDSECYTVDLDKVVSDSIITIRKYRIPTRKANLKGTPSAPILLYETDISAPANLVADLTANHKHPGYDTGTFTVHDGVLALFSVNYSYNGDSKWGVGYTQYLWEIDAVNETATETVIQNTSGETLLGMLNCIWVDDDTIAFVNGHCNYEYNAWADGTQVYVVKRTQGTFGSMDKYANPNGQQIGNTGYKSCGWRTLLSNHDGRIMVGGGYNGKGAVVLDTVGEALYVTNATSNSDPSTDGKFDYIPTDVPLISFRAQGGSVAIYRDSAFMSTIFNCATAYTKDATKTMTVVYRLTFEEEDVETTRNAMIDLLRRRGFSDSQIEDGLSADGRFFGYDGKAPKNDE